MAARLIFSNLEMERSENVDWTCNLGLVRINLAENSESGNTVRNEL